MHNHKNKWLHNVLLVGFYLLLAPPVLAAVKDSIHGAFTGVMAWDLFYNVLGGAGGGGKADVLGNVQRASLVAFIEHIVGTAKSLGIAPADVHRELAPGVVGVHRYQGVVKIEKSQFHSFSSMDLMRGMVIARWVRRAY